MLDKLQEIKEYVQYRNGMIPDYIKWLADEVKTHRKERVFLYETMNKDWRMINDFKDCLVWVIDCYKASLCNKPVKNLDEVFSYAEKLLKKYGDEG